MKYSELVAQQSAPASTPIKYSQLVAESSAPQEASYNPTDDMSTVERIAAGMGQGAHAAGQGYVQNLLNNPMMMGPLGMMTAGTSALIPDSIKEGFNRQVDESARVDAPLKDTTSGAIGSVLGEAMATGPVGLEGLASKGLGWLAKTGKAAMAGAKGGGFGGLVQPVAGANENGFTEEKLKQVLTGAGTGAVTGGALNRAGAVAENAMNPLGAFRNAIHGGKALDATADEGERLAKALNVDFTPAQVTGGKTANALENATRQSWWSRDKAFEGDKKRTQQLYDHFQRTMDGITKSNASPATAGAQVQGATRKIIGDLEGIRNKHADQDFGRIRAMTNGKAAIQPESTNAYLKSLLADKEGTGTEAGDKLARWAQKQLSNVDPATGAASSAPSQGNLDKLMALRREMSKASVGKSSIGGDLEDRHIAVQMLKSIDDDIEKSADAIGGDLGAALKEANGRYREFSNQIKSVNNSPLGKILGEDFAGAIDSGEFNKIASETVIERLGRLKGTQLGVVKGILEKSDPETWQVFKRSILEDAINKASERTASGGVSQAIMRPSKLINTIGDSEQLTAVFSPKELAQIQDGLEGAYRLGDATGYNFSNTANQQELLGAMNGVADNTMFGTAMNIGKKVVAPFVGTRHMAQVMNDADGRRLLIELKRLPAASQRAREITAKLAGIAGVQEQE